MKFSTNAVLTVITLSGIINNNAVVVSGQEDNATVVVGQEVCENARAIPPVFFNFPISGSTINKTATTEGCDQNGVSRMKQWYKFELNADLQGYFTWVTCVPRNSGIMDQVGNAIQTGCDDTTCVEKVPGGVVDPNESLVDQCRVAIRNVASHTMLWTGMENVTHHAYVALGSDEESTDDFITTLVQHQSPPNDSCEESITLEMNAPPTTGTLYNAMPLTGDVCTDQDKVSVWYSFVGHNTSNAVIRTCPTDELLEWEHTIDVVENCGDTSCACVDCEVETNLDCPISGGKQLTLLPTQGDQTYQVAISTFNSDDPRGNFNIQVLTEDMIGTNPPTATSMPSTMTSNTSAPVSAMPTTTPSPSSMTTEEPAPSTIPAPVSEMPSSMPSVPAPSTIPAPVSEMPSMPSEPAPSTTQEPVSIMPSSPSMTTDPATPTTEAPVTTPAPVMPSPPTTTPSPTSMTTEQPTSSSVKNHRILNTVVMGGCTVIAFLVSLEF